MDTTTHDDTVRSSFRKQLALFSGDDSPFARRDDPTAWLGPLDPQMSVLDVACGAGHASEPVAPLVRQVVGIDLTRELLALGARRLAEAGVANVLLQEGNALDLPFVDGCFDVVFSRTALHHFADPDRAVTEMARVARPGGRVVLLDMVAPSAGLRDRYDQLHRQIDPSHTRCLLEDELADTLAKCARPSHAGAHALRLPVEAFLTEQSEREEVLAALRDELAGGAPTGFQPAEDDGALTVALEIRVVHGNVG